MKIIIKKLAYLLLLSMFYVSSTAQQDVQLAMKSWAFPGLDPAPGSTSSQLLNVDNDNLSSLPNGPTSWDYQGQIPQNAYASYSDYNGDLVFFIVDDQIYDNLGYQIETIDYTSRIANPTGSGYLENLFLGNDMKIIKVPEECDQYYIVFTSENVSNGNTSNYGFYYVTLDFGLTSFYNPSRSGKMTSNHYYGTTTFGAPISLGSASIPNSSRGGLSISFTYPENGERFMYLAGGINIERFTVDNSGFTDDNYDLNVFFNEPVLSPPYGTFTSVDGNGSFIDSDIIPLENGDYKLAVAIKSGSPSWPASSGFPNSNIHAVVANIDGSTGDFTSVEGIQFPSPGSSSTQHVKGLELSQDGRYLYAATETSPYLHLVDLNQTISGTYFTTQSLSAVNSGLSTSSPFKKGNIAKDRSGELYFANSNGVSILENSNDPTSNWTTNAHLFTIPEIVGNNGYHEEKGYHIPSQVLGKNELAAAISVTYSGPQAASIYCAGNSINATILGSTFLQGNWSNGGSGNSTQFTLVEGENTIHVDIVNQYGCTERFETSIETGFGDITFTPSNPDYCPNNGPVNIDVLLDGVIASSSLDRTWSKDGVFYSSSDAITADGPGIYCVVLEDPISGCESGEFCVTVVDNNCGFLKAEFSAPIFNRNPTNYTIYVNSNETRSCAMHDYYIFDLSSGSAVPVASYTGLQSGTFVVGYSFNYNTPYQITHSLTSNCSFDQFALNLFFTPRLRRVIEDEGESGVVSENVFYPNPTNGFITIQKDFEYSNYIIVNTIGEIVNEGSKKTVDLSEISSGLYFVSFFKENGEILSTKKLMKR